MMKHTDKKTYPKISVITPSYNQGQFLEECMKSVLDQNYPNLEYIVIDGGSKDQSVDIIKKYESKLAYWVSETDGGQSQAINKGFSHATGDLIAWLNSDDLYYGNSLWKIAELYDRYEDILHETAFIMGNGYRYRWPEQTMSRFCPKNVAFSRQTLAEGLDYILQPSVFVLRKAAEQTGYLNEDLQYCMDWDWWYRLSLNYRVIVTDQMLSLSREYEQTKTSTGRMRRWTEICQLADQMSGKELTAGGLFYLAETLQGMDKKLLQDGSLKGLWEDAKQGLCQLCGQADSFPYESDASVVTDVPVVNGSRKKAAPVLKRYPKITVITPSYNQAEYLERTIQSVLDQNYPNLEYLIFDAGSTDGSVDIIKKYESRLTAWNSGPDHGPADAVNKGLRMATGEIVGWLNSDDAYTENALFRVAEKFLTGADVAYGHALYVDGSDRPVAMDHGYQKTKIYLGYQQAFDQMLRYWETVYLIPQPSVFWKKDIMDRYGRLDEHYQFIFDYEYFLRLTKNGIRFSLIDEVQALYRIHDASKTSSFDAFYKELYEHSRKHMRWDKKTKISFWNYYRHKTGQLYRGARFGRRVGKNGFLALQLIRLLTGAGNPEAAFERLLGGKR